MNTVEAARSNETQRQRVGEMEIVGVGIVAIDVINEVAAYPKGAGVAVA